MDDRIKQHLTQYCKERGWDTDDDSLIDVIKEEVVIYKEDFDRRRWWNEYRYVTKIDGMFIGYIDAEATGGESVGNLEYEFDPSTICEMVACRSYTCSVK